MKILLSWLSDYIQIDHSADQIADILSDIGFPCEGMEHLDGDAVIDLEVTSNRGDCLSYIGLARELAAVTGKQLKIPEVKLPESEKSVSDLADVEILDPDLCCRYTARVIEGVKVGPSPDWLKNRLEAVGMRSVNNIVDATNYALMETGQPPHAFDYQKINDHKIIVRKARPGERIVSIDGSKCDLDPNMLIIADTKGPVAIAGVMGGLETEVNDNTTAVLLEDAYFEPISVRTTSRKLALPSESSFRFERIVDAENIDWASKRTAQLITQVAGGKVAKGVVDIYPEKPKQKKATLRLSRLNKLLGIEVPQDETTKILSGLAFQPEQKGDSVTCTVPSWRSDIYREVDLIEEVARIHGYNKLPTEKKIKIEVLPVDARQKLTNSIGTFLNGCGFYEAVTVSFVDDSIAELFTDTDTKKLLAVKDVSRKNANILRQTLLGSLLGVLKANLNAGNSPCRMFEIADTFMPPKDSDLPIEETKLTLVCDSDLRDLRGVIEALINSIDKNAQVTFTPADLIWAQTGAQIQVNGKVIGTAGIVSQKVKEKFDFDNLSPVVAELDFQSLSSLQSGPVKVKPIPKFPAIERDLSIIVEENVPWIDITESVNKKAPAELENIQFVGIYRGKGIPAGKKSLTLSIRFRDEDGTLTHETVDAFQEKIVKTLTKSLNAELRTV
ncbi:MAG: phenylalanine--tRNA ligase subunit beta [Planctomycetes bacterium]|nr:phenylalanine--tRNA ligase subunit beta [Planctomycetota bacterium]